MNTTALRVICVALNAVHKALDKPKKGIAHGTMDPEDYYESIFKEAEECENPGEEFREAIEWGSGHHATKQRTNRNTNSPTRKRTSLKNKNAANLRLLIHNN